MYISIASSTFLEKHICFVKFCKKGRVTNLIVGSTRYRNYRFQKQARNRNSHGAKLLRSSSGAKQKIFKSSEECSSSGLVFKPNLGFFLPNLKFLGRQNLNPDLQENTPGADSPFSPSSRRREGRCKDVKQPLLPTGIGERYGLTILVSII
jgi:hypothetical protein